MRILYVSGSYPPVRCGVGDYVAKLVAAVAAEDDVEAYVVTSHEGATGPRVVTGVPAWNRRAWRPLAAAIGTLDPDIVHLQHPSVRYGRSPFMDVVTALVRTRARRAGVVVTLHEYHAARPVGKLRAFTFGAPADALVVSTATDGARLRRLLPGRRVVQIPIGSNIDPVPRHGANHGEARYVAYFGLAHADKGVAELLASLPAWPRDVALVLITILDGDDPEHRRLRAAMGGAGGRVSVTGHLPEREVGELLAGAAAIVLPFAQPASLRRGSLLAALTSGAPTITTGPLPGPLRDERDALALPDRAPATIAAAINRVLADPALAGRLRAGALATATAFGWPAIARRHIDLYRSLVA